MITDKNKIDDNWFPYDSSPSLSSKIIGTIILISIIFFYDMMFLLVKRVNIKTEII